MKYYAPNMIIIELIKLSYSYLLFSFSFLLSDPYLATSAEIYSLSDDPKYLLFFFYWLLVVVLLNSYIASDCVILHCFFMHGKILKYSLIHSL
jgi:hypothetical protein